MSKKRKNDSSEHRIFPMMECMMKNKKYLVMLLNKIGIPVSDEEIEKADIFYGKKDSQVGVKGEMALIPPKQYLIDLIEDLPNNEYAIAEIKKRETKEMKERGIVSDTTSIRLEMISNDKKGATKRDEAIRFIKKNYRHLKGSYKRAYLLEGSSKPDVFIETDDKVIVIEGKWTEPTLTESTTYQKDRNQMVRHIHNALNYVKTNNLNKQVYGFYIVDETFANNHEYELIAKGFREKLKAQFGIKKESKDSKDIMKAYKEYTTWRYIKELIPNIKNAKGWMDTAN